MAQDAELIRTVVVIENFDRAEVNCQLFHDLEDVLDHVDPLDEVQDAHKTLLV